MYVAFKLHVGMLILTYLDFGLGGHVAPSAPAQSGKFSTKYGSVVRHSNTTVPQIVGIPEATGPVRQGPVRQGPVKHSTFILSCSAMLILLLS